MKALSLALGFALLGSIGLARPIHWSSDLFAHNVNSEDARMTSDYRFELGVFSDGFTPTADNMEEWAEYWAPAQRVSYHSGNAWFTGRYIVSDNEAPFTRGTPAYIWGFSGDSAEGEWLLFRASNWSWPLASRLNAAPLQWNVSSANQVIIGDLGTGSAFQLRTARVQGTTAPATTYPQWLAETGAEPGRDSLIEFFSGGRGPLLSIEQKQAQGQGRIIQLSRLADRQGDVQVQYSTDLINWHNADGKLEVLENTPAGLRFVTSEALGEEPRLFFRAVASE